MKELDLIYVSYNSEKWIKQCFDSITKSDYDLNKISIYVVDNASKDNSLEMLYQCKDKLEKVVKKFEIISPKKNLGFGKGNNLGFKAGNSPIVCFLNIDTELYPNTLSELVKDIEQSDKKFGLWELRQFPYEHPKIYDALTHETVWSSGAAFAMYRQLYEEINGFDERFFMYCEDVDLSWRVRCLGYSLKYVPKAVINHYAYQSAGEIKPNQYLYSIINNLMLRYRFGTFHDITTGHKLILKQLSIPGTFKNARKKLLIKYLLSFFNALHFLKHKSKYTNLKPLFLGFDYAAIRDGAFYVNHFPENKPLVSIIVRTCGRPDILRETLISLRLQTYSNIEIVIVEDGENISEKMIKEEFSDLNIIYKASGEKVGRSKVGNIAMNLAHGKYLNFLDDDDLFYADHVEVLVAAIEGKSEKAVYAFGFCTPIEVLSKSPYKYKLIDYLGLIKQDYNKLMLFHHNYIPIECLMFEKSLFLDYGGFDESLDALEDWDLFVRFSLHTDFLCIPKTTSIYRVPANNDLNVSRQKMLDNALLLVREKHKSYKNILSAYDFAQLYEDIHKL